MPCYYIFHGIQYDTFQSSIFGGWQTELEQVSGQITTEASMEYTGPALRLPSWFVLEVQYVQRILWFHYLPFFHHS